jgi:glycine cleavage system H protein
MASVKENLLYAETHEWADIQGSKAKVGISDYRQDGLGEIVYVEFPEVGAEVKAGEKLCEVESIKAVTEIMSPVSGKVVAVNSALEDAPNSINEDAYGAWICEIEVTGKGNLMDAAAYEKICD